MTHGTKLYSNWIPVWNLIGGEDLWTVFSTTTVYKKPEKLLKYDRDLSTGLDGEQVDDGKWIGRDYIIGETLHKWGIGKILVER